MATRIQEGGGGMGSSGSVKIVKATSEIQRKSLNAIEQTRVNIIKSGAMARGTAAPIEARNAKGVIPKKTIRIRTTGGLK